MNRVISLVTNEDGRLERSPEDAALLEVALECLDSLREALVSGEIKAFIAVGIAPSHSTYTWVGKSKPTTTLELLGAWALRRDMVDDS